MPNKINLIDLNHMESNARSFMTWRSSRLKAIDYYNGSVNRYTRAFLDKVIAQDVPLSSNNITKRVTERISIVFIEDVIRKLSEGTDKQQELYIAQTINKDTALHFAEKRLNLLNMVPIKITPRNGVLDYLAIDDFELEFGADPLTPTAISYPLTTFSTRDNMRDQIWIRIDAETITKFTRLSSRPISTIENPLGILPFVFAFTDRPQTGFLNVDPANDLVQANELINVMESDMSSNIHFQSFSTMVVTGMTGAQAGNYIKLAPNKLIAIPGSEASITVLSPKDSIVSITAAVQHIYNSIAQNYHLPFGFVKGTIAESGISLKIRSTELLDERKGAVKNWRSLEHEIYEIEKIIFKNILNTSMPESISIDFGEHNLILSVQEQREQDQWDLDHNLITEAQILMRNDPDNELYKTEEGAQARIELNKKAGQAGEPVTLADVLATEE